MQPTRLSPNFDDSAAGLVAGAHALSLSTLTQLREQLRAACLPSPQSGLPAWLLRSWQRCLASGLRVDQRCDFEPIDPTRLRRAQDSAHPLLQAAQPALDTLAHSLAGSPYFALLTNASGVVLRCVGARPTQTTRAALIAREGVDLSEAAVGTTAIGLVLADQAPVWLHQGEHFLSANTCYSCAGAPIRDPADPAHACLGMLDLTGIATPARAQLRHLAVQTATRIEDALLGALAPAWLLHLNWPGASAGAADEGVLAIDADGRILGANAAARALLGDPPPSPNGWGQLSDWFGHAPGALMDDLRRAQPIAWMTFAGWRLAGWAQPGQGSPTAWPPSRAVAVGDTPVALRTLESHVIDQALRAARGNVAWAARQLGISRATLYRKLARPAARPISPGTSPLDTASGINPSPTSKPS